MSQNCPICNSQVSKTDNVYDSHLPLTEYSCPRCGNYIIDSAGATYFAKQLQRDINKSALLSHWVRTKNEAMSRDKLSHEKIILTEDRIEKVINNPLPNPAEQADNFVRWIGDNIGPGGSGKYIGVHKPSIVAIIGAIDEAGFYFIFDHLKKKGLILHKTHVGGGNVVLADVTLSFEGWQYYEELKRGEVDSRKAFMAMQYGDKQLDKIVDDFFKLAVKQTGFDLFKLPDRPQPTGLIDDQLRVEIQTSRFLIADLTHGNQGAYWEAGYAEGLGKPVIYTCEKKIFDDPKAKPHFDTNHHLTILWDAENPNEAAAKLKATIRATLPEQAKLTDD